jgi:hypothetical protein
MMYMHSLRLAVLHVGLLWTSESRRLKVLHAETAEQESAAARIEKCAAPPRSTILE